MVSGVAWAPDGKLIAIASTVGIYIYNSATIEEVSFIPSSSVITCVAFSPDSKILAAGSRDRTVRLWRVSDEKLLQTLTGDTYMPYWVGAEGYDHAEASALGFIEVTALAFSPDGLTLASGYIGNSVRLWQVSNGKLLQTLDSGSLYETSSLAYNPNGNILAMGSSDIGIALWNVSDATLLRTIKDNTWCVAFSPDGKTIVSGGYYGIDPFRVSDGALLNTLGNNYEIRSVAFSPDGQTMASIGRGTTAKLWRVSNWTLLRTLGTTSWDIGQIAFSPDGQTLMLGENNQAGNGAVSFFRVSDGTILQDLKWFYRIFSMAFSPDGQTLAIGGWTPDGAELVLRRVLDGSIQLRLPIGQQGVAESVNDVAFSPDGRKLAFGGFYYSHSTSSYEYQIQLLNASDGTLLLTLPTNADNLNFSRDSQTLAYKSNGKIFILNISDGKQIQVLEGQSGKSIVGNIVLSPDGLTVAAGSSNDCVWIWRISDGKLLYTLKWDQVISNIEFSPDGQTLAAVSAHVSKIRLWNASDGTPLYTLKGDQELSKVEFNPDGKTLAAVSAQGGKIQLWNLSNGTPLNSFLVHIGKGSNYTGNVTYSPDGRVFIAMNSDGVVEMLDSSSGVLLYTFIGNSGGEDLMAISPDGTLFATGSQYDGTITLWGNAP